MQLRRRADAVEEAADVVHDGGGLRGGGRAGMTHLTGGDPAYEEQAVFTPDMRDVIVMTSRARPGTCYQTVITAALWTPRTLAWGLFGAPIDMARVRGVAGDLRPARAPVPAPRVEPHVVSRAQSGNATGSGSGDRQTIPPVVGSYVGLLLAQLHDLAALTAVRIGQPTL